MQSITYLENKGVEFKIFTLNETPRTAQDVERIYGCPLHQVLKTLVFVGKTIMIAVLPGHKRVNTQRLRELGKDKNLRLATPHEVKEITGCTVGSVSPFCVGENVLKIFDSTIFEIDTVNIGSGKAGIGIEMKSSDLKKVLDCVIANISS